MSQYVRTDFSRVRGKGTLLLTTYRYIGIFAILVFASFCNPYPSPRAPKLRTRGDLVREFFYLRHDRHSYRMCLLSLKKIQTSQRTKNGDAHASLRTSRHLGLVV